MRPGQAPDGAASQALVTLLWAAARLRHVDRSLFAAAARHIMATRGSALSAQDVSNATWAFAAAGCYNAALFDALCQRAGQLLPQMTLQVRGGAACHPPCDAASHQMPCVLVAACCHEVMVHRRACTPQPSSFSPPSSSRQVSNQTFRRPPPRRACPACCGR